MARKNGILFFTACHYERVPGGMTPAVRQQRTLALDEAWRNGFYVVTGMSAGERRQVAEGIGRLRAP